jgi:glycosyltransferase involved in cell wall biosynthesis
MRILYSHRVQSHDGQSVHIEELVSAFRSAGHEVLVIGPKFYEQAEFGGESRLVALARRILPGAVAELAEILYNVPAFFRLRRAQKSFRPDFIYERYNLFFLAGALLARRYDIPFYLEVNSPLATERARFGDLRLRWLARKLEPLVWRSADRIFVVTGILGSLVARAGVPLERITVVPNGVDRKSFPDRSSQVREGHFITIGFVGFARPWHGLNAVITGLATEASDPPIRLVIVGPVSSDLEQQARELGVAHLVQFTGLKQRNAIPDIIRTFDIALQPSAVCYASPLKVFEYMACGRAIVAPDQPNIREILLDGENAILFDAEERGALWHAIRRLANDRELRERLGQAARRDLETHDYTWQGNVSKITSAFLDARSRYGLVADVVRPVDRF